MKPVIDILWALLMGGAAAGVIYLIKLGYEAFSRPLDDGLPKFVDEEPPF